METYSNKEINKENNNKKNNSSNKLKRKYNDIKFSISNLKNIINIIFLLLLTILLINIIIFLIVYNYPKKPINKIINNKIKCELGYYVPNDDLTKCLKCSINNCNVIKILKLNNVNFLMKKRKKWMLKKAIILFQIKKYIMKKTKK